MMPDQIKRYAIVNTSSTFDKFNAKEALDAALILASYEMAVSLFFIGDGVYQTQASQNPELIDGKDFISSFKALSFYDIEDIYISEACLAERQLTTNLAFKDAKLVNKDEFSIFLNQADVILTF
ncbi:sulfurtransferase complex subunit TusC [Thalassotalea psychrophila]|uniref:Sulfurtransferase complex subunit TusC n=1 Tax=Thalassotalea psychrophila TaxID=3065647 RepID=A0ABY9TNZ4_9GAMM|nr:sulfurtransferase complex subunit TusC [Colwelliaceae bacterium SQ149]